MAKKSELASIANHAVQLLKDAIGDVQILGQGRGDFERYHAATGTLFKVLDVLNAFNPYEEKRKAAAKKEAEQKAIEHKKAAAIEHKQAAIEHKKPLAITYLEPLYHS